MGSAASSEPEIQSVPEDQGAPTGVRMTISSRVIDDAIAFKSSDAPSSRQSANQGSKNDEAPKQSSNASGAQSKQQTRQEHPSQSGTTPLSLGTEGHTATYAPDEQLEGLRKQILSTTYAQPAEFVWAVPTVEMAARVMIEPLEKIVVDERAVLESMQTTYDHIQSIPKPKSFHSAVGVQAQPICSSDYIAATDCIKSGNPSKCSQLMDSFAECSAAYHFKQQAKMAQAPRQL